MAIVTRRANQARLSKGIVLELDIRGGSIQVERQYLPHSMMGDDVPYAVDVSSGLEATPGIKAPDLMQAFFEAVWAKHGEEKRQRATGDRS